MEDFGDSDGVESDCEAEGVTGYLSKIPFPSYLMNDTDGEDKDGEDTSSGSELDEDTQEGSFDDSGKSLYSFSNNYEIW